MWLKRILLDMIYLQTLQYQNIRPETSVQFKTQKMVLDPSLLYSQHYKVRIKGSGAIQGKE